ncbi:hypothetical protein M422DRAFT_254844 [Sphaerobolus stellatus SS14]|uniref:DUF6533 domain-containing protein n=1 Tax=Sphaerobolus stellatus (strain SS14) TaxID=990650 RepID=A0A0C9VUA5_SPHS4|nr:hypothetical protein M422DRAFT_254844 [Sphaerobolus stellatus SS14]
MDPSLTALQSLVTTGFSHLLANKYYVLASTVLVIYDHMLTFDQEREFIWKKKITFPSCLFLTFRYVTPIVSALNLIALNWPGWKGSICRNWIWLPVAVGPIADLSAINAPFASLITAVLVARLFLNLREAAQRNRIINSNSETLQDSQSIGVWQVAGQSKDIRPIKTIFSDVIGYNEFEAPLSVPGQGSEEGSSSQETTTYGPSHGHGDTNTYELQAV